MASKELSILIDAKDNASAALNRVSGSMGRLGAAAKRSSVLSTALGVGLERAAETGFRFLSSQVTQGIASMEEFQNVQAQTQAALKSTGSSAGISGQQIRSLAMKYEDLNSTIDDKVIQSAENLLLTFKNVRGQAFEPTLKAALDINQRLGGGPEGLQGTMLKLGRAMNDPTKYMGLLARSGIVFDDQTKKQIVTLQKQNNLFGAQQILLQAVSKSFGGSFAAAGQTAAAKMAAFHDAVEDARMALAEGLLPSLTDAAKKAATFLRDPKVIAQIKSFGQTLGTGLTKAIEFAQKLPWGSIASAFELMGKGAKAALDLFLGAPPWLQTAIVTGWGLNKITGGAAGSLFSSLASGLIKGVLGMNAGVVNINAGVVNGGGGPGGLLGAGGGGGLFGKLLKGGLAVGGGIAIGDIVGQYLNEHGIAGIGGSVAPAKAFETNAFQQFSTSKQSAADIQRVIKSIQDNLNPSDFAAKFALALDVNGVRSTLEQQLAVLQQQLPAVKAAELAANVTAAKNYAKVATLADKVNNADIHTQAASNRVAQIVATTSANHLATLRSIGATTLAGVGATNRVHSKLSVLEGVDRGILAKKTSVSVNASIPVTVVNNLSINEWQRKVVSQIRSAANYGGFI